MPNFVIRCKTGGETEMLGQMIQSSVKRIVQELRAEFANEATSDAHDATASESPGN
jgi:hypothetical protein